MARQTFAGYAGHQINFPRFRSASHDALAQGIADIEDARVVEVGIDPSLKKFQFSEVYNKAVFVRLGASERQVKCPVVAVDKRAMLVMVVLPMGKGYVGVGFSAGKHMRGRFYSAVSLASGQCLVAEISDSLTGALGWGRRCRKGYVPLAHLPFRHFGRSQNHSAILSLISAIKH